MIKVVAKTNIHYSLQGIMRDSLSYTDCSSSCSIQLNMKFILLINVEMPTSPDFVAYVQQSPTLLPFESNAESYAPLNNVLDSHY